MQVIATHCCGLDVHQKTVVACLLVFERGKVRKVIRTFGTTKAEILELHDWLVAAGCTHVAMESTGVYWKPIYNLFEGAFEQVLVVNAQHMKALPGRKTDVSDSEWIADLLQHGLLQGSFIPSRDLRELRELVRYRKTLIHTRSAQVNRLQKVLEGANIKLSSVISDITGVSGRAMLEALVAGETNATTMAQLARRKMKKKQPELEKALTGTMNDHQRYIIAKLLEHIDCLDRLIQDSSSEIERRMNPLYDEIQLLCTIPGVGINTAQLLLAEIGWDMARFPSHRHLASWAGLCPGNHESAGKRKSGKTRKGSKWLRSSLQEAAKAARRTRNTYLAAVYRRLSHRRGANKAATAVAHAILVIAYHILKSKKPYQDLGPNFFDQLDRTRTANRLTKRLEALGYEVILTEVQPDPPAA